jgi:hypothetical protein
VEITYTVLIGLAAVLHLQGWIYAIQILHQPNEHGWTWTSVGTGTSMIAIGEAFAIFILYHFNSLGLIPAIVVPITVPFLLGIPMVTLQIFKKVKEDLESKKIKREHNFAE